MNKSVDLQVGKNIVSIVVFKTKGDLCLKPANLLQTQKLIKTQADE